MGRQLARELKRHLPHIEVPPAEEVPSAPSQRTVKDRRKLWGESGVFKIKVPPQHIGTNGRERVQKLFMEFLGRNIVQYGEPVQGGNINVYVHPFGRVKDGWLPKAGETFVGSVEILEKTFDDGKKYLYVDVHPLALQEPTHELRFLTNLPKGDPKEMVNPQVFPCPAPLVGGLAIGHGIYRRTPKKVDSQ